MTTPKPGGGRASDDVPGTDDRTSTDGPSTDGPRTGGQGASDGSSAAGGPSAGRPGAPGGAGTGGGAPDLAAVLELLQTAPPEVRDWLLAQTAGAAGDATTDGAPGEERSAAAGEPEVSPDPAAPGDEPDPMDEDDADDDILTRRAGERATEPGRISRSGRWVIALAVVAGVIFGVWYAGRPAAQGEATGSTTTPTMSSAVSDEEAQARVEELTAVVEADPADTAARLELGVLLFNAGETEQAGEQWLAVTELAPDEQEAWYNLGFYYVSTEPADYDAAGECWERVVEIDPGSELAEVATMHLGGVMGSGETTAPGATSSPGADQTSTSDDR